MSEQDLSVRSVLHVPTEVRCEYAGVPQGQNYTDLEQAIRVCETFPERFAAATGYAHEITYSVPATAYEGVAALGGELVFSPDHQPMIRGQGRILTAPEQVDALHVPDPWGNERFLRHVEQYRSLKQRFGDQVTGGLAGQEGPITTAGLLRGEEFFIDCAHAPARAHHLLDVCTDMLIRWNRASVEVTGGAPAVASICDDYAGMLGPDMWAEFVVPYYQRIIRALGPEGGYLHTELVRRGHLAHYRSLNLVLISFAENEFLTIRDVQEELPGMPFGWHIKTVAEMLQGSPDAIRRRYREIVSEGVDNVHCELAVGTPVENIKTFLEMAHEYP